MPQKFKSEIELEALNPATTDTDKILVSDGGVVKSRTGAEILSDIGGVGLAQIANFETTSQLNIRDTNNRNRLNHTGTQLSSTISDLASLLNLKANLASPTFTGIVTAPTFNGEYNAGDFGLGLVGLYSASRYQSIFSMGAAYKPSADGITIGNSYGLVWTHTNVGGQSKPGLAHQMLVTEAGITQTAIGKGIWTIGQITSLGNITAPTFIGALTGNASSISRFIASNSSNPVQSDTVNQNVVGYVNSMNLFGQIDGALYGQAHSNTWQHQIFGDYRTGQIAIRGKNNNVWQSWRTVLDSVNFTSGLLATNWAAGNDSRIINGQTSFNWGNHANLYLPLTGGTLTGQLTLNQQLRIVMNGITTTMGALNNSWNHMETNSLNGWYFYNPISIAGGTNITSSGISSTTFIGALNGNATSSSLLNATAGLTTQAGTGTLIHTGQINNPTVGLFPAVDNSNSIITVNRHSGSYYSQLGFSSNGNMYYRSFSAVAINTTQSWKTILDSGNFISGTSATNWVAGNDSRLSNARNPLINYNNNTNASFQMLWGSGNVAYGTGGVLINPSTNTLIATTFQGALSGTATSASSLTNGAQNQIASFASSVDGGTPSTSAIEIRELNRAGPMTGAIGEAPRIGFHWGNRNWAHLNMSFDGTLNYMNSTNTTWLAVKFGTGTFTGNITAPTFIGNLTGNAETATSLTSNHSNWNNSNVIGNVVGMLAWKAYGNNHVIFDASNSTAPNGVGVNNTNSQQPWTGSFPTLMGWNGFETYGVRVDSARVSDLLNNQNGFYYNQRNHNDITNFLGGYYVSGGLEKPNNTLFGSGKLKLAMLNGSNLGIGGAWHDVLYMSGYTGGDVKLSTGISFSKNAGIPEMHIFNQDFDSANWGTPRRVWHSGNFNPATKLDLTGGTLTGNLNGTTANFSSTVTATDFIGSSDKKLKKQIKALKAIEVKSAYKTFVFKSDKTNQKRVGVIAQELELNHPEFVRTDDKGIKSVSYGDLHSAEIAYLKSENKILKAKLELIMNKLGI